MGQEEHDAKYNGPRLVARSTERQPNVGVVDVARPSDVSDEGARAVFAAVRGDLEPSTVLDDDTRRCCLGCWIAAGPSLTTESFSAVPAHRITLPEGESIVVAHGDRLLDGTGTIQPAVPDH